MQEHVKATFSFQSWGRRVLSLLLVVLGFWVGMDAVSETTGWAEFGAVVWKPLPVIGLGMAVIGAILSASTKRE